MRLDDLLALVRKFKRQIDASNQATQKLIKQSDLSDEELLELIDVYDDWEADLNVVVDDYYKFEGNLYQVITAHTTQADWKPSATPALFNKVQAENVIPEFVQPTGSHDAYNKSDRITFEGKLYESTMNNNTWSPSAYPAAWEQIEVAE